jgi:TPR repeat protein
MEEEPAHSAITPIGIKSLPLEQLEALTINEDADVLYEIGLRYKYGARGVSDKNPQKSFEFFEKAADKDHPNAVMFQARMLLDLDKEGLFTEKEQKTNEAKCLTIIEKRIKEDDPNAQHFLGWMYTQGIGVPKSLKNGLHWYRAAAESGHIQAQEEVGCILMKQRPFVNREEGVEFLKKAAEKGSVRAKLALGKALYVDFYELEQRWEGLKILESLLENNAEACFIFAQGRFKKPDPLSTANEAAKPWLEAAKRLGHVEATTILDSLDETKRLGHVEGQEMQHRISSRISNYNPYYEYGFSPSVRDLFETEI